MLNSQNQVQEIEDGEIVSVQGSPEAPCKTPSKLDRSLHVLSETENIPSNGDLRSMPAWLTVHACITNTA